MDGTKENFISLNFVNFQVQSEIWALHLQLHSGQTILQSVSIGHSTLSGLASFVISLTSVPCPKPIHTLHKRMSINIHIKKIIIKKKY